MIGAKVVVVEDDARLLNNVVEILNMENYYAKGAACALDFFQLMVTECFDVAIVDVGLPDKSGFEIVEYLRSNTKMGVIILTARENIKDKVKGYKCGADYYFVKPVESRELLAAINNIFLRIKVCSPSEGYLLPDGKWGFNVKTRVLMSPNGTQVELTLKEQAFIECLSSANGHPVTRKNILMALGYNIEGPYGNRSLDVMIVRLRKKIKQITGCDSPIKTVRSFGYSFQK